MRQRMDQFRLVNGVLTLLPLLLLALFASSAPERAAQAQRSDCQLQLGFKALHDQIPELVGACLENQWHNGETGDALQRTTGGLLVWRKADNWTAFTDGATTWLLGPQGLVSRPNEGPLFSWEARPGESGIEGQALLGPTCPVQRSDQPCPDRPYQATITVLDSQGAVVTRFQTDAEGRFRVPLSPGLYLLRPESPGVLPRSSEQRVTVRPGQMTTVTIQYDSGIR